jgi:glucose-6-phosphate isomerase
VVHDTPTGTLLGTLTADRTASRLWAGDTSLFADAPASDPVHDTIRHRLGWLKAPSAARGWAADAEAFARETAADGLTQVLLLGMGGSSLCAEVLRDVRHQSGPVQFIVLDTTDERAVLDATDALVPAQALFLVASKSGSTIEVTSLEAHFWSIMQASLGARAGRHFAAITDPGTPLVAHGESRGYRRVFVNPADIGGRYSALSLFGLVPAALLGWDLQAFVNSAETMAERCRGDHHDNPGLALGAFMAAQALAGRDKLTLVLGDQWRPLGAWIEQLVAESTGKQGRGVLPIVDEPVGAPAAYGADRQFVVMDANEDVFAASGHPVMRLDAAGLGGEFFRWEFATAVCGAALGVNPFDEPNVRDAKARTQAQLDLRRARGSFDVKPPFMPLGGVLVREHTPARASEHGAPYLAILDYLPRDPTRAPKIAALRSALRARAQVATTYGSGPRYLHSTGQYHKGGPNSGVHVLLTATDATTTSVPGTEYTFSVLKHAQALGDFEALAAADRRVVHLHLDDPRADVTLLLDAVAQAV